jgi:hypothetical protein
MLLRRVVAVMLTVAFLLAPYHSHPSASSADGLVVAAETFEFGHSPDDGAPTQADGECVSCLLMKQVQLPNMSGIPLISPLLVSSQFWLGDGYAWATLAIFGVFRPPIFIAA